MAQKISVVPETPGQDITLPCASDLSALQYTYVRITSNKVVGCAADDRDGLGILQNKPVGTATRDADAIVRMFGFSKASIGSGGAASGAYLKVGTAGVLIDAGTTDRVNVVAKCVGDAAASDIATVLLGCFDSSHA